MKTPLAYIPTEVVLLDDDNDFLTAIRGKLNDDFLYSMFTVPETAIKHIEGSRNTSDRWSNLEEVIEHTGYTSFATRYDFSCMHREVYSPMRCNEISVVVVDYAMPQMNGLEFLSRIKNKNIKRILLTGEADAKIAVDAFNRGLIDKYIQKMTPMFMEEVKATIQQFAIDFWYERTKVAEQVLIANYKDLPTLHSDVQEYFRSILEQYAIKEYYMMEGSFRFLLVDEQGKTYTLWIQRKAEADALAYEFEACEGNNLSQILREEISTNKKILCVPVENGVLLKTSEWIRYCRDAEKIGSGEYFGVLEEGCDLEYEILSYETIKVLRLPKSKDRLMKMLNV